MFSKGFFKDIVSIQFLQQTSFVYIYNNAVCIFTFSLLYLSDIQQKQLGVDHI